MRQRPVRLEIVTENRPSGNGLLPSFNVQEVAIFTLGTLEANGPERPAPMIRDESRRTGDFLKEELPILWAVDVVKAAHRPILQPHSAARSLMNLVVTPNAVRSLMSRYVESIPNTHQDNDSIAKPGICAQNNIRALCRNQKYAHNIKTP